MIWYVSNESGNFYSCHLRLFSFISPMMESEILQSARPLCFDLTCKRLENFICQRTQDVTVFLSYGLCTNLRP